jgi:hypothetical protein
MGTREMFGDLIEGADGRHGATLRTAYGSFVLDCGPWGDPY